jgi:general secretion pathway protein G
VYRLDNYRYPSSDQGLQALVERPTGRPEAKNWNPSGYLKKLPQDPWGTAYLYEYTDGDIQIISLGADGVEGGEGNDADIRLSDL